MAEWPFSDHHDELRKTIRTFVETELAPHAKEWEEGFPDEVFARMGELGFLGLAYPEEYGGGGGDYLCNIVLAEEMCGCNSGGVAMAIAVQTDMAVPPLFKFGTDEQKQRFLPKCATGEWSPAFALSEPEAGSDPGSARTTAVQDGDEWVINGTKNWITNAGIADFYVVFAVTDPSEGHSKGISAFVVEADRSGFSVGKLEHKLGIKGSPTGQPVFEDVRVPAANLIGDENQGMKVALGTLDHSRLGVAAQAVGIAQGALDAALRYAGERQQFGRRIAELQGIQFMLADMAARTEAARQLTYAAAVRVEERTPEMGYWSSTAKLIAGDTAMRVTTDAVQVLGGYGYMREYGVERMMRDAKITQIYEGTNQVQRLVIARQVLRAVR